MKRCVYTVLTGGYETLNEQPAARDSSLPFICFTDDPGLTSETWQLRRLMPLFGRDDIRNQRASKLLAHEVLPEFAQSLYIDNSVVLKQPPERLFEVADLSNGLAVPAHSFRNTVLEEFHEVAAGGLDDPSRIAEQLLHYQESCPQVLREAPVWAAILLRDHNAPAMRAAMRFWLAHVLRYARRDQLSANAAFAQAGLLPALLAFDNYDSAFHSWPHHASRRTEARLWRPQEAEQALAARLIEAVYEAETARSRLAAAEQLLQQLRYEHDVLLRSTAWRLTAPLRRFAEPAKRLLRRA